MSMLESALRYAALGWFVFPLHSIRLDRACGCGNPDCRCAGKHPRIKWKAGASCDIQTVRGYWTKWPHAGIGCATGPSRLLVADADGPRGVMALGRIVGRPPPTARARTRRGVHVFFRGEGGTRSDGDSQLDTRGAGGFVVLAPSPHASGFVYAWEVPPEGGIADAPATLIAWSLEKKKRASAIGAMPAAIGDFGAMPADNFTTRMARALETPDDWHEVARAIACIPADCRMDEWIRVGMALHSTGHPKARLLWDRWSASGREKYQGESETSYRWSTFKAGGGVGIGSLFAAAQKYGYARRETMLPAADESRPLNGHAPALPEAIRATAGSIRWPDMTEGGKIKATCANAVEAIRQLGVSCKFDQFHERFHVAGHLMESWAGELSDPMVQRMRVLIRDCHGFDPGKLHMRDALEQECLSHSYHPIKDYFNSLQWDGTPRIDTWLIRYMGANDDSFNREVGRLCLLAGVRRILQPGCKFDQIITFDAKEGTGKSTAIEIMAGRENFSDQSILDANETRQQELLQGVWLYEIADLQGHSRAEVEKVKAFASRTTDRARPAYGHFRVDKPRTCVLFATTNPNLYLTSPTGNRRFWPITTGRIDLDALRRDRDQLWAEALLRERGASLSLHSRLWSDAAERQESRRERDPWEDRLAHLTGAQISSYDVIEIHLQIPTHQQSQWLYKRVAHVMRKNGWDGPKPIRIGQKVSQGYTRRENKKV
jgi:hypothetical protein